MRLPWLRWCKFVRQDKYHYSTPCRLSDSFYPAYKMTGLKAFPRCMPAPCRSALHFPVLWKYRTARSRRWRKSASGFWNARNLPGNPPGSEYRTCRSCRTAEMRYRRWPGRERSGSAWTAFQWRSRWWKARLRLRWPVHCRPLWPPSHRCFLHRLWSGQNRSGRRAWWKNYRRKESGGVRGLSADPAQRSYWWLPDGRYAPTWWQGSREGSSGWPPSQIWEAGNWAVRKTEPVPLP